jgi:hypothetical protein
MPFPPKKKGPPKDPRISALDDLDKMLTDTSSERMKQKKAAKGAPKMDDKKPGSGC